jgi:hypothetical protein
MNTKKFLIDMNVYWADVGGIVALHKLCHDIRTLGRECYITSRNTHPKLNAPFIGSMSMDVDEWVVLYPEITNGNPHRFKHVVRWVLYTPKTTQFYEYKKSTDLIFKYSDLFEYKGDSKGLLTTWFIDYECFTNRHTTRDVNSCFLIKKKGAATIKHSNDSIDISNITKNWEEISNVFNRCKYFYCYDNECFWVTLAALCGCIPIVIPNNSDMSSVQWKTNFPWTKYGIAYGEEEIDWAISSSHLVKSHCLELEKQNLKTVSNMIGVIYYDKKIIFFDRFILFATTT